MLSSDEIARSTSASWALFKGDMQALRAFDTSFEGFWRSFAVFFLLIPVFGILTASERLFLLTEMPVTDETFPSGLFVWSRAVGFTLGWLDYPILLAALAGPLGFAKRYVPLVVALNWTSLVAAVPTTIPHLLHVLGVIGDETTSFLSLIALGLVLRYQYVVTRAATSSPPGFAVGLVALDFVASLAVASVVSGIFGI